MEPVLEQMVRDAVDANRFMVLGTVEPDGQPRLSPVYFTHDGYRTFYWISSHEARHSENLARHPRISLVIFDSSRAPGDGEAVYLSATAEQVPDGELAAECAVAFRNVAGRGARPFAPEELADPEPLRLYRAVATGYDVHIPGSHPTLGRGIDARVSVDMP